MKKTLRVALVVVALGAVAGGVAAASDVPQRNPQFQITKGKQFELCRELEEIINLPENNAARSPDGRFEEIKFPARYRHFKPVEHWETIPAEKVKEYLYEPGTLRAIEEKKEAGYRVHKTWDGKGPLIFEKVTLNFDHWPDNGPETIVRFRFQGRSIGTCVLADRDAKKYDYTVFSGRSERTNGSYYFSGSVEECQIFTHKGRVYRANGWGLGWQVNEPESSKIRNKYFNTLYDTAVCYIVKSRIPQPKQ